MSFFGELRRRNVLRVGIAYLAAVWVLIQIADTILPVVDAPPWVFQALVFVVDDIDSAEIEGAYERAGDIFHLNEHIRADLGTHDTDIKFDLDNHDADIKADLDNHDADIKSDLGTHDAAIKADLGTHDADIKADLGSHDADIKADLGSHDADIKADLVTHDFDIKALLTNIQAGIDLNGQKLDQILILLRTPPGRRPVSPRQ